MQKYIVVLLILDAVFGQVVMNEIMFKPTVASDEWIELYNYGASDVDISNWTISDPNYTGTIVDTSFIISPGEFVIISEVDTTFTCNTIFVDNWPYLNNDGDTLYLRDSDGNLVDMAVYTASSSWEHDVSLELSDYTADGSDPANWFACTTSTGSTPCQQNSVFNVPVPVDLSVSSITLDPTNPQPDQSFTATVSVSNLGTETASGFTLTFEYISGTDTTSVGSVSLPDISASGSDSEDFNLSLPAGTYTLLASVDDTVGSNNQLTRTVNITEPGELPDLKITEIMFKPTTSNEEWLELYNAGDVAVDLANWTIVDPGGDAILTTESFIIEPGEFAIVSEVELDGFSCPYLVADQWEYLNNEGDSLRLFDSDGQLIDSAFYSVSSSWDYDVTLERDSLNADGGQSSNWLECTDPSGSTPCNDNSVWPTDYDLAITSMSVNPFRPDPNTPFTITAVVKNLGTLTASGYTISLYLDADRDHAYSSGDSLISTQSIPTLAPDETNSIEFTVEFPHGMYSFVAVLSDTVRTNNECNISVQVGMTIIITEIMFKPEVNDHEWIELFNAGDEDIDLANWTIGDPSYDGTITTSSLIIEPGNYAIISQVSIGGFECGDNVADGWPYLNNDGDEVFLKNSDGETVDHAVYTADDNWSYDVSAERISIYADGTDPDNWKPSRSLTGSSPCQDNTIWSAGENVTCDITQNPFDPERGEQAGITINAPADATIEMRIYDLRGRVIKDFGTKAAALWDGNDDDGNPVPTGPYVIVAKTTDNNGKVDYHKFAIAVARGMKK